MASRYYETNEAEDQPGKLSKELREALCLPNNEIPIWIYRMRALGYPPGWLKKAEVDTSDIFDTDRPNAADSKKRKNPPEECEATQYDHSKLIEYPGFNSPMPANCHDYHYSINMPAMLEHQQLEYAKKHMNAFKPVHIPKKQKISSDESIESSAIDPESPDDEEDAGSSSKAVTSTLNSTSASSTSLKDTMRLVSKGSPMPKPVTRAPLEKFSEGVVGDLLYFENLPQSTGKFDSIRGLLSTMRKSKSEASLNKTM